jgi:hypothetical protein
MEPENPLPCSQESVTVLYPEIEESTPHPPKLFLKIHFNIILLSTYSSSIQIF